MSNETPDRPAPDVVEGEVMPSATPSGVTPPLPDPDYDEQGVPSFDFVRDKIEKRIATAIGGEELAEATPEGREADEMMRKRDEAAKRKLDEIRKSMGK